MPTLPAAGYSRPVAPSVDPLAVAPDTYQQIPAPAGAFGAGTATALRQFGAEAEKAADHFANIQTMFDQAAADDLINQAENKVQKLHYGDPDIANDTGFRGLSGKAAMEAWPGFRKNIDAVLSEHRAKLQNLSQQMRFDQNTRAFRNYTVTEAGRHYDRQFEQYRDDQFKASMKNDAGKIAAAAAEDNPEAFDTFLAQRLQKIDERGKAEGWAPETADYHRSTAKKEAVKEWVESTGTRDPLKALEFLERNKDAAQDLYPNLKNALTGKAEQQQAYNDAFPEMARGGGAGRGPTLVRGGAVQTRISEEAAKSGLDPATILAFADIESSMGRNLGQRGNIFQLGQSEWSAAGGGKLGDTETDIKNGLIDIKKREADLSTALGRKPEGWELYLAHQQGVSGAISLLTNPNTPAGNLVRDPSYISGNSGNPNAPASQFVAKTRALFEDRKARYSGGGAPAQPSPAAGGDTQPPGTLTPPGTAPKITMAGDSLAAHPIRQKLVGGQESGKVGVYNEGDTAVAGWNSQKILDDLIPKLPETTVKGQNVAFSTGISNVGDPKKSVEENRAAVQQAITETVPKQIAALKARGATNIVLMGVGTDPKLAGANEALAKVAADNGVGFAGPQRKTGGDKIHSTREGQKDEVAAVTEAFAKLPGAGTTAPAPGTAPAAPATPGPTPPPPNPALRPDNDVPGLQAKLADINQRAQAEGWGAERYHRAYTLARTQLNAAYTDQQHRRQEDERAKKEVVQQAETAVIADAFSDAPKITTQQISVDPRFAADPDARMRMLALKARLADKPPVDPATSSNTMHELMRSIAAGDITDRRQIIDEFNAQPARLSEQHFNFLMKQLDDVRTPEGLKVAKDVDKLLAAAKASITKSNPLMGSLDASGDIQFGAFEEDIRNQVEAMKADKKTPAEIAEFLSVKRFRDNPGLLEPYQKPLTQSIQDQSRALSRPPPPPPPGTALAPVAPQAPAITQAPNPFTALPVAPAAPVTPSTAAGAPVFTAPIPPVPPNQPSSVPPRLPGESASDYMQRTGGGGGRSSASP